VTGLHEEVLSGDTATVFARLGELAELADFYLAGGTSAALQIGHRRSLDLDLFTERPWFWESVSPALASVGALVVDRQESGTFVGSVAGVRTSLFHYPYVLLEAPTATRFGIPLAGLRDIGCMKLVAISQRGSRKDFIDLYFLGKEGLGVRELLRDLSRKAPGVEFNPVHILRSLAFFADAEAEPEPVMLAPCEWSDVKRYCIDQAHSLLDEILEG
jgi:hypothetical protein